MNRPQQPALPQISPVDLLRIEELFHGLIRSRAREGNLPIPAALPTLDSLHLGEEPSWFPVPGMYGGFAYRLEERESNTVLVAESWCRVAGGSGMRHVITPTSITLEAEGFVQARAGRIGGRTLAANTPTVTQPYLKSLYEDAVDTLTKQVWEGF